MEHGYKVFLFSHIAYSCNNVFFLLLKMHFKGFWLSLLCTCTVREHIKAYFLPLKMHFKGWFSLLCTVRVHWFTFIFFFFFLQRTNRVTLKIMKDRVQVVLKMKTLKLIDSLKRYKNTF